MKTAIMNSAGWCSFSFYVLSPSVSGFWPHRIGLHRPSCISLCHAFVFCEFFCFFFCFWMSRRPVEFHISPQNLSWTGVQYCGGYVSALWHPTQSSLNWTTVFGAVHQPTLIVAVIARSRRQSNTDTHPYIRRARARHITTWPCTKCWPRFNVVRAPLDVRVRVYVCGWVHLCMWLPPNERVRLRSSTMNCSYGMHNNATRTHICMRYEEEIVNIYESYMFW